MLQQLFLKQTAGIYKKTISRLYCQTSAIFTWVFVSDKALTTTWQSADKVIFCEHSIMKLCLLPVLSLDMSINTPMGRAHHSCYKCHVKVLSLAVQSQHGLCISPAYFLFDTNWNHHNILKCASHQEVTNPAQWHGGIACKLHSNARFGVS